MQKFTIITDVCVFFIKLWWPNNKRLYDTVLSFVLLLIIALNIGQYHESTNLPKGQVQFPILDHKWRRLPKTSKDTFKIWVYCASLHRVPTCDTTIPAFVTPVFWTVWVPALAVGSCFTVILLTLPGVKVLGVVIVVEAPTGAVTGVTAGILTVTAGLGLIGVETDDWEMVRATTGLARTWACCKQHKGT